MLPPPPAKPAEPLARDWREYHRLAAQRLVAANPDRTYLGAVPEPLKGIPILEVELNADGSVRRIAVQRRPKPADAQHTTQLAIDAVRRADLAGALHASSPTAASTAAVSAHSCSKLRPSTESLMYSSFQPTPLPIPRPSASG